MNKRLQFGLAALLAALIIVAGWLWFNLNASVVAGNCGSCTLYVRTGSTMEDLRLQLDTIPWIKHPKALDRAITAKRFTVPKAGRYVLKPGTRALELVEKLRAGNQDAVRLTFKAPADLASLAGKVGSNLEPDSVQLYYSWLDWGEELHPGIPSAAMAYLLPNTYEIWWNGTAEQFRERMEEEYNRWWTPARRQQAENLGLSPFEVSVLASIVEKETQRMDEMPVVAGLYLNRLRKGMKLQADPTVIFAVELSDPSRQVRRVLYGDLRINSPYNTYRVEGLPPGPICVPSLQALEAVLSSQPHTYLYMCADPDRPGYHAFASNLRKHAENRRKYVQWLQRQGIRR